MHKPPWEREWLQLTPLQFECLVVEYLQKAGIGVADFKVRHQEAVAGPDGEYIMDAVATFQVLGGAFRVLIECKHHRNPIKRELVQVLADKVRSVRAHKGMLFSTAPFQQGAVEYAESQGVALVHFTEGGPRYETRTRPGPSRSRPHEAHLLLSAPNGPPRYRALTSDALLSIFSDSRPASLPNRGAE